MKIKEKIKIIDYSIYSFLLTILTGIIIFTVQGRLIGGSRTFLHYDMLNQMIPFIKMFLRQLFVNHNIIYSLDFFLGGSTIPVYAFYSCFSPFNLILLLPIDINISAFLLVICKFSFGAFCFHELLRKMTHKKDWLSVVLSVSYALCGFNIAYYQVVIWSDGIYLLPIIIILIINLTQKSNCSALIIAYACLFIFNFYTGYVIGIYTFIFFVIYLLLICKKSIKEKIVIVCQYFVYVLLAVMLAAVILLPTAIAIINGNSSEELAFNNTIINLFDLLKQFYFGQRIDEVGFYPYVYAGLLPFIFSFVVVTTGKISKKVKLFWGILLSFLIICSVTIPGYMFIHAFNNPDGFGHRYAYLYAFTLCLMMSCQRESIKYIKKNIYIIIFGLGIIYIVAMSRFQKTPDYKDNIINNSNTVSIVLLNCVFLIVYMALLVYFVQKKYFIRLLSVIMLIEIIANGCIYTDLYMDVNYEIKKYFNIYYNEEENVVNEVLNFEDVRGLYMPKALMFNNPQMMGYRSVNVFSSILDSSKMVTLRKLGYKTNYLAVSEAGSTPLMRMLFGQNYYVLNNDLRDYYDMKTPEYGRNEALEIAFMASDDILDLSLDDNNPFVNQNDLLSALCGEEKELYYNTGRNIEMNTENMLFGPGIYNEEEVFGFAIEDESVQKGIIEFVDKTDESEYAYFEMLDSYAYIDSPNVYEDTELYNISFKADDLSEPRILEMKKTDDGSVIYIIMDENTAHNYYYKMAYFYADDNDKLDEVYRELSVGNMNIDVIKDGYVAGTVLSTEDKDVLFTSIPFEEGWEIYVDGFKSETASIVEGLFLGARIPLGEHYVELKYRDKWMERGGIISMLGLILYCFVIYFECIKNKNNKLEIKNE